MTRSGIISEVVKVETLQLKALKLPDERVLFYVELPGSLLSKGTDIPRVELGIVSDDSVSIPAFNPSAPALFRFLIPKQ